MIKSQIIMNEKKVKAQLRAIDKTVKRVTKSKATALAYLKKAGLIDRRTTISS